MNYLDIAVVLILIGFLIRGRIQGFVKSCLGFLPAAGALFITNTMYPYLSSFLRGTFIFDKVQVNVSRVLGLNSLDTFLELNMKDFQIINELNLPGFFKKELIANNNSVIYNVLGADTFGDYISAYVANACINALSIIVLFIATFIILKLLINMLDLVSKLPGINFLNKTLGAFLGVLQGIVVIWLLGIILIFLYSNPGCAEIFNYLNNSKLAIHFYENNLLLFMILKIIA